MNRGMTAFALAGMAGTAGLVAAKRMGSPLLEGQPPGLLRLIDGESLHYVDSGRGEPIVLIHGFLGSTFSWREVIPLLSHSHRVIALDLAGFGFSDRNAALDLTIPGQARRVVRLLDALRIESATIVGHSLGGGVAEHIAASFPARVDRLVLVGAVDTSVRDRWQQDTRGREMQLRLAALAFRSPWLLRKAGRRAVARMTSSEFATHDVVEAYIAPLLLPGTLDCIRALARGLATDPLVDLSAIEAPTLIISGDHDNDVLPAVGEALAAGISGARHVVIPSGHLIPEEHPVEFLAELLPFLDRRADDLDSLPAAAAS